MEKYFNDIVDSICKTVRFDSSLKPAEGNCPFGKETADCLGYFLSLASEMGFETHNYDNYVGEVIFGEGEEFAILAHLDVVPAGSGWRFPPFGAAINDELSAGGVPGAKIWGRGTMDDKGPALAALHELERRPELPERLRQLSIYARKGMTERGLTIRPSALEAPTPIIPIYTYETYRTLRVAADIYDRGVYVNPTLPPATPEGEALLRTSYMATHTEALLDEAMDIIGEVMAHE